MLWVGDLSRKPQIVEQAEIRTSTDNNVNHGVSFREKKEGY